MLKMELLVELKCRVLIECISKFQLCITKFHHAEITPAQLYAFFASLNARPLNAPLNAR